MLKNDLVSKIAFRIELRFSPKAQAHPGLYLRLSSNIESGICVQRVSLVAVQYCEYGLQCWLANPTTKTPRIISWKTKAGDSESAILWSELTTHALTSHYQLVVKSLIHF